MTAITPREFLDGFGTALDTFWADRTPIAWPNKSFDPESLGTDDDVAWLEVQLLGDPEGQTPIGSSVNARGSFQRAGTLGLSVYVKGETSTDLAYDLVDAASSFLEGNRSIPNTVITGIGHEEIGADGIYYQINVTANFLYFTDRG